MNGSLPRRRRPSADLHFPPECRDMIRQGALVTVNVYGERLAMLSACAKSLN